MLLRGVMRLYRLESLILLPMLSLLLSFPSPSNAQSGYTSVTATVVDANGSKYTNSPYTVTFFDPGTSGKLPLLSGSTFQKSYNGYATDGNGNLSISLPDNSIIASSSGATGTQWIFNICTAVGAYTTQFCIPATNITISGASQNISSTLTAVAPLLPLVGGIAGGVNGNLLKATSGVTATDSGIPAVNVALLNTNNPSFFQLAGGTCTVAGIAAAITSVGTAGTVDARGCTVGFTWGSTLTISTPVTLYMPCANVTFTAQLLNITSDDVHIHFCGSGTSGQIYASSNAGSTYTASGLGGTTNAIVIAKTTRSSQALARLSGFSLDGLAINMNGVGNRAIYMSSAWSPVLQDVVAYGGNCTDGLIYQEADEPTDGTLFAASYFARFTNVVSSVISTNTTCHPFYFDSSNGEIGYPIYQNLFAEGYPQAAGSGSDLFYISTGSSNVNQSFDQAVLINLKGQDPTTNNGGIKFQCRGNFGAGTGGRCFDITIIDPQMERIFSTGGSGTGIGCINNAGSADGTGCGAISIIDDSPGGWAVNEDSLNLGNNFSSTGLPIQGAVVNRYSGPLQGTNATLFRMDHTFTPTANSQNLFSTLIVPNVNKGTFTGVQLFVGPNCDMGDATVTGTGTIALGSCFNCNTASWATINYCYSGNGTFNFVEGSAPNVAASSDNCGGVAATHSFQCSFNGDGPFTIARDITATSSAFATATTAGTCVQNVTAVTGAATSMAVAISPVSTPGVGAIWSAFVSSAGNVTINECAVATSAGGTIAFNIRVIP